MDKNKIVKTFIQVLEDHGYEYETDAIWDIVETSIDRKAHLIEMFRKHPNWDEDQLCIHFDRDLERKTDAGAVGVFMRWLWRQTKDQIEEPKVQALLKEFKAKKPFCSLGEFTYENGEVNPLLKYVHEWTPEESAWGGGLTLYDALAGLPQETLLPPYDDMPDNLWYQKYISYLNEMDEKFNFRPGMKLNRVINKICQKVGLDKLEGYNRAFAEFSDGITPLKISRHTTISVNPIDFLLMSNGNSWRSCHYIGDDPEDAGCYSSGTISYMMAEDSFIVSVIDKEWDNDNLALAPKINRQVFGYNDHQLVQSRLYPQDCDSGANEIYRNLREMVEEIIAKAEGEANRWVKAKDFNVSSRGTAYEDWYHFSNCGQYELRDFTGVDKESVRMSRLPVCIKCGHTHSYEESIVCEDCKDVYCYDCGERIDLSDPDSYVYDEDNDRYYCSDCRFICGKCGEIEKVRDSYWISDIDERWCSWCAERYAAVCDKCGEWFTIDSMYELENGEMVCEDCKDWYCEECEECGGLFYKRDMVEVDEKWYCAACAEEKEESA